MQNIFAISTFSQHIWTFSEIQDAAIVAAILDDAMGPKQCHNPLYLPYLVDHMAAYLLEVKYFPNIATP